jgi:hypothetical protein
MVEEISIEELLLTQHDVYMEMGCPDKMIRDDFSILIREVLSDVKKCKPDPRYCFIPVEATFEGTVLAIDNKQFNIGNIIFRQLRNCEGYVAFVATAGAGFDDWQKIVKSKGDIARIYIADIVGSIIVEKVADKMERELDSYLMETHPEWHHTNRFSPGYCGWHVSEQYKLFSLFPEEKPCGVTLTSSSLMLPIKSVSGIIGLGEKVRRLEYSCGLCNAENCYKRKRKS